MEEIALVFALMAAVAALATLADRIGVPYPILLVLGGLGLGFIPGLPRVALDPEIVFLLFLPPLLFGAAYATSWRDFRANLRPIGLLAVGLVLTTTVAVAVVAHLAAGLPWAAAFVLGAVVSPTDAIAATAIAQRLGVPRRIVTILEGESLVNDATGIVAYRIAAAVAAGTLRAALGHHAGEVEAERQGQPPERQRHEVAPAHADVDVVEARRVDAHQQLVTLGLGRPDLVELQDFRSAETV